MSGFEGTGALLRLVLRRDRLRLPVWVLALVGICAGTASAVTTAYPTQRAIDSYADSLGSSPSAVAMAGPPVALHTLAGVVIYETVFTTMVGVSLMAIFIVNRHTRAEEEEGRTELLRSVVVGRHAGAAAAMLVNTVASVLVGAGVAVSVVAATVPVEAAVLLGVAVAGLGVVFGAITLCLAQVYGHGRTAVGASLAVLGATFVLRAAGDVREDWLVWLSPIGWAQATHPVGENRWWPLLVSAAAALALLGVAVLLAGRRDVGSGMVAPRAGSPTAAGWLSGPVGLAFALQRYALLGWAGGVFVLAAASGSLSREMESLTEDNPQLADYFATSGGGSLTESFFATMLLILAIVVAGFTTSSALRLRAEETSGRLEPLLATGLTRTRWLLGSLVVTVAGTVLVLALAGFGLGLTYGFVVSDLSQAPRMAGLALLYAPAVLSLAGLAVVLVGWLPQLARLPWALLGYCFVVGWLGGLLRLPDWAAGLSPFEHIPDVPLAAAAPGPPLLLALVAVALVAAGLVGFRRRDVT